MRSTHKAATAVIAAAVMAGSAYLLSPASWAETKPASQTKKPAAAAKNTAKTAAKPKPAAPKKLPKLVDLGADKCIPCKMMMPVLDELKKNYKGQLEVVFIDVWKDRKAGEKYKIQSIPTQIFYDANGKELYRHIGYYPKDDILAKFKEHKITLKKKQ